MTIPTGNERRKYPRARLSLEVEWGKTPACALKGRVTNLGVGGCFVSTRRRVAEGGVVFVRLMVAPVPASALEGVVTARVLYHQQGTGFGAEFTTLKAGYEKDIQDVAEFYHERER